jgi:hypothetical protein
LIRRGIRETIKGGNKSYVSVQIGAICQNNVEIDSPDFKSQYHRSWSYKYDHPLPSVLERRFVIDQSSPHFKFHTASPLLPFDPSLLLASFFPLPSQFAL